MAKAYQWWYLDFETDDGLTVVAIVFEGFPFLPKASGRGAFQVEMYRDGRRVLSVMAIDTDPAVVDNRGMGHMTVAAAGALLEMEPGSWSLSLDSWASLPGLRARGRMTVEGHPAELAPFGGGHQWAASIVRGRGQLDLELGGSPLVSGAVGYADTNRDTRPLARSLRSWVWARQHGTAFTTVAYQISPRSEPVESVRLVADREGKVIDCDHVAVVMRGRRWPSVFGLALPRAVTAGTFHLDVGRPCLTAPFYVRVPTIPRGLAEIGRPWAIPLPGLRHLVAMRPTGPGPAPPDANRILHRVERIVLGHRPAVK